MIWEEEHTALRNEWLPRAAQVGCEAVTYLSHTQSRCEP